MRLEWSAGCVPSLLGKGAQLIPYGLFWFRRHDVDRSDGKLGLFFPGQHLPGDRFETVQAFAQAELTVLMLSSKLAPISS